MVFRLFFALGGKFFKKHSIVWIVFRTFVVINDNNNNLFGTGSDYPVKSAGFFNC